MQLDFDFTHKKFLQLQLFLPSESMTHLLIGHMAHAIWNWCRQPAAARINHICTMCACLYSFPVLVRACTLSLYFPNLWTMVPSTYPRHTLPNSFVPGLQPAWLLLLSPQGFAALVVTEDSKPVWILFVRSEGRGFIQINLDVGQIKWLTANSFLCTFKVREGLQ